MSGCLLRVNNLPVTSVKLRPRGNEFDIIIDDQEFGEFPLTRSCYLEYLDLATTKSQRECDPFHGWKHVTYDELVVIVQKMITPKAVTPEQDHPKG